MFDAKRYHRPIGTRPLAVSCSALLGRVWTAWLSFFQKAASNRFTGLLHPSFVPIQATDRTQGEPVAKTRKVHSQRWSGGT